jgi:Putative Actinobacterial Holin-X, holin superfamily III
MSDRNISTEPCGTDNRPVSEIAASALNDLKAIVRDEIRLALTELKDKIGRSRVGVVYLAMAAFLGFLAVECFVTFCIAALAIVLPVWLSALLVGVVTIMTAGGVLALGISSLQKVDPLPRQTLESLKDNLDWAKERLS